MKLILDDLEIKATSVGHISIGHYEVEMDPGEIATIITLVATTITDTLTHLKNNDGKLLP